MAALSAGLFARANGARCRLALSGYFAIPGAIRGGSHGQPEKSEKFEMSYYDPLETRDPDEREADLMDKLARQVAHAKETTHYISRHWPASTPLSAPHARRWPNCR
jgi:hypothetical protein